MINGLKIKRQDEVGEISRASKRLFEEVIASQEQLEQRVADFVGRVYGAQAMEWGRYARAICYAPAYSIQGGMNTILRNVIGERTLGLPKEPR